MDCKTVFDSVVSNNVSFSENHASCCFHVHEESLIIYMNPRHNDLIQSTWPRAYFSYSEEALSSHNFWKFILSEKVRIRNFCYLLEKVLKELSKIWHIDLPFLGIIIKLLNFRDPMHFCGENMTARPVICYADVSDIWSWLFVFPYLGAIFISMWCNKCCAATNNFIIYDWKEQP